MPSGDEHFGASGVMAQFSNCAVRLPCGLHAIFMIRFRRVPTELLDKWLVSQPVPVLSSSYRLRVWREDSESFSVVEDQLKAYIDEALDDARRRIRRGLEDDLSPFKSGHADPAANYPALLHRVTLFGYFGETLAVLAVEHWGAHGYSDWKAPAFLFRLHNQEFQHLDSINERIESGEDYDPDNPMERRPGRTGDDGLAFRLDGSNRIIGMLVLEAKCLSRHNDAKVEEAHRKLASSGKRPTGVRELVALLADYDSLEAETWQQALLELWYDGYKSVLRYDGVAYSCNHTPQRPADRVAWLPSDRPHPAYTIQRSLDAMEFQFTALERVVETLYRSSHHGD